MHQQNNKLSPSCQKLFLHLTRKWLTAVIVYQNKYFMSDRSSNMAPTQRAAGILLHDSRDHDTHTQPAMSELRDWNVRDERML